MECRDRYEAHYPRTRASTRCQHRVGRRASSSGSVAMNALPTPDDAVVHGMPPSDFGTGLMALSSPTRTQRITMLVVSRRRCLRVQAGLYGVPTRYGSRYLRVVHFIPPVGSLIWRQLPCVGALSRPRSYVGDCLTCQASLCGMCVWWEYRLSHWWIIVAAYKPCFRWRRSER